MTEGQLPPVAEVVPEALKLHNLFDTHVCILHILSFIEESTFKATMDRAGEMGQQLRAPAVLAGDLDLGPRTTTT